MGQNPEAGSHKEIGDAFSGTHPAKQKLPSTTRMLGPWHLFKFANRLDCTVLSIGVVFAAGQGATMPMLAIIFGDGVSATAPNASALHAIEPTLKTFGILCLTLFAVCTVWQVAFIFTAERQCAKMRKAYLLAMLRMDISWFDLGNPAELPTRMAAEVQAVQEALGPKTGSIIVSATQFVAGLAVAFTRSEEAWKMCLLLCASVPIFGVVGMWMAIAVNKNSAEKLASFGKAGAAAEEALGAVRTVAAFGGEERESERFESHLRPAKRAGIITGLHMGGSFGLLMASFGLIFALAFWFSAHHMSISGAEVIMVFFAVIIGVMSLGDLGDPLVKWGLALAMGARILQVLDEKPEIECDCANLGQEVGTIQEVTFTDVSFKYPARPEVPILSGLSLSFKRGQKLALVGESGSGKSTVVQLLERFYDPVGGQITVNGVPLRNLTLSWWRSQIGYVGQEPVLFATSVRNNLTRGDSSVPQERIEEVAEQAQAYEFLKLLPQKFDTYVGTGGNQMSGGQKQRLAIARALLQSPQILLLDEATSALDTESEIQVQTTIDGLQATAGSTLTTISIAHRLSTIERSDVIFFLRGGRVEEQGSHAELMARHGCYWSLLQSQESAAAKEENVPEFSNRLSEVSLMPGPKASKALGVEGGAGAGGEGPQPEAKSEAEIGKERLAMLSKAKYSPPMMRLLSICKREWALFPLAFIGSLVGGAVFPSEGYILAHATEAYYKFQGEALKHEISMWAIGFVVCGLGSQIGELMKWGFFTYIQESLALRIRSMTFRSLMRQDVGFFDDAENNPSGLTTMLERQSKQVSQMASISLGNAVASLCGICCGLTLAFLGTWRLTLACLGLVPVVMVATAIVMMSQLGGGGAATSGTSTYSHAGAVASEALLNIRTVRALRCEQQSLSTFGEVVDKVARKAGTTGAVKAGAAFGFGNSVSLLIYIAGFWYGAYLVDEGLIVQSSMFQSLYCIMFGLTSAGMAVAFAPDAAKGKLAAYDIFNVLDRKSKVDAVSPEGTHRSLGDSIIAFKDVVFRYPHRPDLPVLHGISFSVQPGQWISFVGPSGSGKSTIIQMLQRFYDPTGGQILVGGVCLTKFDVAWWRRQVAMVGQEPVLFNWSLEDNVKYGKPEATRAEVEAAARKAKMDYALNGTVAWEDSVGLRGGRLSGGQKQRCAIARAIVRSPSVLLLDEATSALDAVAEKEVQQALDEARAGRTTFTISHRMSTVVDSDQILVIVDGMLAEQGTHSELISKGDTYFRLAKRRPSMSIED